MFSLFDCHCDTLTTAMSKKADIYDNSLHISLKRLTELKKCIQVFAVWLDDPLIEKGFENTCKAIDFFDKCQEKHRDILYKATDSESFTQYGEGKIISVLAVEGGEAIGESLDNIEALYNRGVRIATLTWNRENSLGYGAETGSTLPLKPFGIQAVKKMESLGILVDVSHLNEKGFYSLAEISQKPFIASHSNAYSLCKHCRNLKDDQLKTMRDLNSMVGINLYPLFLNEGESATIEDILRHTDYMGNILGEDKLCLGCDFDGIDKTPDGIDSVSDLYRLYTAFTRAFGKNVAESIFFENMYNFMLEHIFNLT